MELTIDVKPSFTAGGRLGKLTARSSPAITPATICAIFQSYFWIMMKMNRPISPTVPRNATIPAMISTTFPFRCGTTYQVQCAKSSTPGQIRTDNLRFLRPTPLPVGLQEHNTTHPTATTLIVSINSHREQCNHLPSGCLGVVARFERASVRVVPHRVALTLYHTFTGGHDSPCDSSSIARTLGRDLSRPYRIRTDTVQDLNLPPLPLG